MIRALALQFLLALGLAASASATPATSAVDYVVTPLAGPDGLTALQVTVILRGDEDGETLLELPDQWAGSDRLHEAIVDLGVEGGSLAPGSGPAARIVTHAPGAALVLRYRVIPASAADPAADFEKARPVIRPGWFFAHGEGMFVTRAGGGDERARFAWSAPPSGWTLISDLDALAPGSLTVDMVARGIFVGGVDLRVLERDIGGETLRVALRGEWSFDDATFADAIARVIAAGNGWMDAEPTPYFVPLIPLTGGETGAMSSGGTGRTAGFALAATSNAWDGRFEDLLRTIAHEYGHRWFGGGLGPVADPGAPEYWFTEGFGDFAAAQTLIGGGLWSEADYAAHLNEVLLRYRSSSALAAANAELAERFWTDPDAMQMPYDRGHLFALTLDGAARDDGGVRAAVRRMAEAPEAFPADETQARRFARAYGAPAGRAIDAALAAMLGGDPIELPADLFAPCGRIGWIEQPVFASGYTAEEDADGLYFATVEPASPAWAAGLRPGMRYIRRVSFRHGDSSVPIVMRIADAAGERELSWLPRGAAIVRFQQFVLDPSPGGAAAEACRARLAGGRPSGPSFAIGPSSRP